MGFFQKNTARQEIWYALRFCSAIQADAFYGQLPQNLKDQLDEAKRPAEQTYEDTRESSKGYDLERLVEVGAKLDGVCRLVHAELVKLPNYTPPANSYDILVL